MNHEYRKKEERQAKGIETYFKKLIVENFPNLKEE
jgi:hypothetical protein